MDTAPPSAQAAITQGGPNRRPAIRLENLRKSYPVVQRYRDFLLHPFRRLETGALHGIDLTVNAGECFVLLGPNGAGKTTLIKILATLVLPTSGRALVNGLDVCSRGAAVRRIVGYILSDERSFYWRLTGRQNLEFFAVLNNLSGQAMTRRIGEITEGLALGGDLDRMFKDYSTGMRQKLAIARGLLTDPSVLLLDEPTRSLDPPSAERLRSVVRNTLVKDWNKTVLLCTHNLAEAESLGDRIAILRAGRVHAEGSLSELAGLGGQTAHRFLLETGSLPGETLGRIRSLACVLEARVEKTALLTDGSVRSNVFLGLAPGHGDTGTDEVLRLVLQDGGRVHGLRMAESPLARFFEDPVHERASQDA